MWLGIDIGTGGSRALLVDGSGRVRAGYTAAHEDMMMERPMAWWQPRAKCWHSTIIKCCCCAAIVAAEAVSAAVAAGYSLEEVEKEPELRALRSDQRYQQWVRRSKEKSSVS